MGHVGACSRYAVSMHVQERSVHQTGVLSELRGVASYQVSGVDASGALLCVCTALMGRGLLSVLSQMVSEKKAYACHRFCCVNAQCESGVLQCHGLPLSFLIPCWTPLSIS